MIRPGGLLLVVSNICSLGFSFMGGVAKNRKTKLACEKYFGGVTY
jgi:hypothetical protein